ncbi:hypothetical protein Agub_g7850 [Astrephomene gubernaculifera]|uniref:Nudix hydrolase domain-containing protein n=1 Tax=Astrephomene gubernaculifera TaxID=47775 RepID=A0AAD3HLZ8_9CHLO|nr:hypothetical protein Agub_g7850 [Astrephomene gubernaculifera]
MVLVAGSTLLHRFHLSSRKGNSQLVPRLLVPTARPFGVALALGMSSSSLSGPPASAEERASLEVTTPTCVLSTESTSLTNGLKDSHPWHQRFDIVDDKIVHRRYVTLYDRVVRFTPEGGEPHTLHYDVVGHPASCFSFAVAFPFHPATAEAGGTTQVAQVTLVREYAQGPHRLMYCLPTGGYDRAKHADLRECARAEMAEEAMLYGGEVVSLLPEDHPGQSENKWSRNTFKPYLFIDPQPSPNGRMATRDEEEHTIEVSRVTIPDLKQLIRNGELMLPSVYTTLLALDELQRRGLIP